MKKKTVDKPLRITYPTYAYLLGLIQQEEEILGRNFQTACTFIPSNLVLKKKQDGNETAIQVGHEIFRKKQAELEQMKRELRAAAQANYKDHPSKEMREFWGVE